MDTGLIRNETMIFHSGQRLSRWESKSKGSGYLLRTSQQVLQNPAMIGASFTAPDNAGMYASVLDVEKTLRIHSDC